MDLVPLQPDAGLAPLTATLHHPLKKWFVSVNFPPDLPDGCLELLQGLEWTMLGDIHLDDGPDVLNGQQVGSVGGHSRRDSVRETPGDSLENVLSPVNHCFVILEQAVQVWKQFLHSWQHLRLDHVGVDDVVDVLHWLLHITEHAQTGEYRTRMRN